MDKKYRIMGKYRNRSEEIDCTDTEKEANYLVSEYQMAYGSDWVVWVEECM